MTAGEPNPTFNFTSASAGKALILAYNGLDPTEPFTYGANSQASGGTYTWPTLKNPLSGQVLLFGSAAAGGTINTPSNFGLIASDPNNTLTSAVFESNNTFPWGETNTPSSTGPNVASVHHHIALRPAQTPFVRAMGTATTQVITNGNATPTIPAGAREGDLLVVQVLSLSGTGNTVTIGAPTGWTQLAKTIAATKGHALYWKICGASDPGSAINVPVSANAGVTWECCIAAFSGVDTADPFADTGAVQSNTDGNATLNVSTPVEDAAKALLVIFGANNSGSTGAAPAGMVTGGTASAGSTYHVLFVEGSSTTGAQGTRTYQDALANFKYWCGFALKPVANVPQLRAHSRKAGATLTSIVVDAPPGIQAGDYLIAVLVHNSALPSGHVPPTGWTEIETDVAGTPGFHVYGKTAGASEPSTYTWSWTNSSDSAILLSAVKSGSFVVDGHTRTLSSATISAPSITPTAAPTLLLFAGAVPGNVTFSQGGGLIQTGISTIGGTAAAGLFYENHPTTAATDVRQVTHSGTLNNDGYLVAIAGNTPPNTPTSLQRTGLTSDTTPVFSADISDPDSGQQIKSRFTIFQNDGVTVVGTVDSSFRTGAGTVTAEYASALSSGSYKVSAVTIDDQGASSSATAQVAFNVTVPVSKDMNLLWNTNALIPVDINLLWNVQVSNQVNISLKWNVLASVEKDVTLLWGQRDPWTPVPSPDNHELWTEVPS